MAFSSIKHTADGSTFEWALNFDYLDRSHVTVRVGGVVTSDVESSHQFTWVNSSTLRVTTVVGSNPVANGVLIEFIRETPIDAPAVVFGGGAQLSSENLNKNSEYLTFALQEAVDTAGDFLSTSNLAIRAEEQAVIAEGYRDQALSAQNAANSSAISAQAAQLGAESARDTAQAHRVAADGFKTGAESARDAAVVAQNAAAASATTAQTALNTSLTDALNAKEGAEAAQTGAQSQAALAAVYRDAAQTARAGAETALASTQTIQGSLTTALTDASAFVDAAGVQAGLAATSAGAASSSADAAAQSAIDAANVSGLAPITAEVDALQANWAAVTATGNSLITAVNADAGRSALGLGTAARQNASTTGVSLITAINADAARSALALGTAARVNETDMGNTLMTTVNADTARSALGLGTAARKNFGTAAGNVPELDGSGRLPAVDGSQITNISTSQINGLQAALDGLQPAFGEIGSVVSFRYTGGTFGNSNVSLLSLSSGQIVSASTLSNSPLIPSPVGSWRTLQDLFNTTTVIEVDEGPDTFIYTYGSGFFERVA